MAHKSTFNLGPGDGSTVATFIHGDPLPYYRTVNSIKSTSLPSKKQELSKAEKELGRLSNSYAELHQAVRASRGHVEEARSALQAHRSRGQVLRALMEQKESGAIPGIHGRLVSKTIQKQICGISYIFLNICAGGAGIFHILTDFCEKIELPTTMFLLLSFSPLFLSISPYHPG